MKDHDINDQTTLAVNRFRARQKAKGYDVGQAHSHELIASLLGYRSRKALLDDQRIDREDPNILCNPDLNLQDYEDMVESVASRLGKLKRTPLKQVPIESVVDDLRASIVPPCECCGERRPDVITLGNPDDLDDERIDNPTWVSLSCARSSGDYGTCRVCGPEYFYRTEDLNSAGECHEHDGEHTMEPEEEQDFSDYYENRNKDE